MNKYFLLIVITSLFAQSMAEADEIKYKEVDTPQGSVLTQSTTIDAVPQEIVRLESNDLERINDFASKASGFVSYYLPQGGEQSLSNLDIAFRNWQLDSKTLYTPDMVVSIIGAYLGNRMVEDLQMEWVLITDEYGTDYAVTGIKRAVTAFPFSTVSKRIDNNEYDFINGVYYTVKSQVENDELMENQ